MKTHSSAVKGLCSQSSVGLCILNNTILQVAIKQDGSYCIMCILSCF